MGLEQANLSGRQNIESYGGGGFRVNGRRWRGSVIVFPRKTIAWPVSTFSDLTIDDFSPLTDGRQSIEILLLGCGPRIANVNAAMSAHLRLHGTAIEPMDTGAACRTFGVLSQEGRSVTAALIAVD